MTISFWLTLLAVLAYGLLHTLLASLKIKAEVQSWFGSKSDQWIRLANNFIAVITLLPILLIDKELYRIPYPWVIATLTCQVMAVIVVIIGLKQTGMTSFIGLRQLFQLEVTTPSTPGDKGVISLRPPPAVCCGTGLHQVTAYHDLQFAGA